MNGRKLLLRILNSYFSGQTNNLIVTKLLQLEYQDLFLILKPGLALRRNLDQSVRFFSNILSCLFFD